MNLLKYVSKIKRKTVEPKVYAVVFAHLSKGEQHLYHGVHYSLEDAYAAFRSEQKKEGKWKDNDDGAWKPQMWTMTALSTFLAEASEDSIEIEEATPDETEDNKNALIKRIVATKDKKLFEANKDKFSENETKYIMEKLKL